MRDSVRLASKIADLKDHYDVVIVGSGYGGAIAASRLARVTPKLSICVLERGRELQPGDYPDTPGAVFAEAQVDTPTGHFRSRTSLYDFRVNYDIKSSSAAGWAAPRSSTPTSRSVPRMKYSPMLPGP